MIEGGLRVEKKTKKKSTAAKPLLTIITVVFNSEHLIENTINSVRNQSYENIEYIVIDGNSQDNTLEIIKKHNDYIDYWLSEPDKGIYDAMNKGLNKANGRYIWFLNSGDLIYSFNTVEELLSNPKDVDILYGETMMIDNAGNNIGVRRLKTPKQLHWKSLKKGMVICHQAIIVKTSLAQNYKLEYKYSADFEWVLQVLKRSKTIVNSGNYIVKYLQDGISRKNITKSLKERYRIMSDNYGAVSTFFNHFPIAVRFFFFLIRNRRF